jgi:hypothetical protein
LSSIASDRSHPGVTPTGRDGRVGQVDPQRPHEAVDAALDEVVVEADPRADLRVDVARSVGHLDQQPAAGPQHQRHRMRDRHQVGVDAHPEHAQATGEVVLPDRLAPLEVAVAAEDVVDQHVEPPVVGLDPRHQRGHGLRVLVVDRERRGGAAGRRDQVAGVLDGLAAVHLRGPADAAAATSGVDVGTGAAELDGDRAAAPARGSRDERDGAGQR